MKSQGIGFKAICAGALAVVLAIGVQPVRADVLNFSYDFASTGETLSGTMDGTLQSDGKTFNVTDIATLFLDGTPAGLPTLSTPDAEYALTMDQVAVSLDGTYMNIYGYDASDEFFFSVGDVVDFNAIGVGAAASTGYGGQTNPEGYVQANWSASLVTTPEPSSMALLLSPLTMLAIRRGGFKPRWSALRPRR